MYFTEEAQKAIASTARLFLEAEELGKAEWQKGHTPLLGDLFNQALDKMGDDIPVGEAARLLSRAAESTQRESGFRYAKALFSSK
jgi:hypothetical protein